MKAVVYHKYGTADNLKVAEIEKPAPKDDEVLVKTYAASVNAADWRLLGAKPFFIRFAAGLFKPRNTILGGDVAGVVESVGKSVTRFKPGDEVYGCLDSCGKGGLAAGGFAEYVCAKEGVLAGKPTAISFEEAAALPMAAVTALQGLRDLGKIQAHSKVLINGASGGVGSFAVQIAKAFGAEVTGVCSTDSMEFVRSLGADHVIDYTEKDFTRNGQRYDLILDIAASHAANDYRRSLNPNGICVVVSVTATRYMLRFLFTTKRDGKTIRLLTANNTKSEDLLTLNRLIEDGKLKPAIDSQYSLDGVAEAIRHVETGHPRGKVIIQIAALCLSPVR